MTIAKRLFLFGACLSVASLATANSMKDAFNEGRDLGKGSSGNAQQAIKNGSVNDLLPNMGSPQETQFYDGQGANPQLNLMGMQALQSSEMGQLLTTSSVNNPADNISPESDMIKNAGNIIKNADYITGGVNGRKCIKQTLTKSYFTYHYCEKDQQINKICKKTANVKWIGAKVTENREAKIELNKIPLRFDKKGGVFSWRYDVYFDFSLPEDGIITGYDYFFKSESDSHLFRAFGESFFSLFDHKSPASVPYVYQSRTSEIRNLNIPVKANQIQTAMLGNLGGAGIFEPSAAMKETTQYVRLYYQASVDTLRAEIEWQDSCKNVDLDNAVSLGEKCTVQGGTRQFSKDGKTVSLQSDCWEKQTEYLVSDASDNECKKYDDNPNCSVGERECISSIGGLCSRFKLKYQCQRTTKTEGKVCGDKFFCSDGSCAELDNNINTNFGHAVSQLATLAQAGQDIAMEGQQFKAFTGRPLACRKTAFGFSNCCKDSGWGHDVHLAKCNADEKLLGQAKEKNVVIYVGTYCDKRRLGKCLRRKSSYCVFDNKLARIIQYQGRSGQLGIGFGGAKNPDCRGMSVEELQQIDFNAMDYSDFYEDLEKNKQLPNQDKVIDYIKRNVASQLQQ